jgi:predicted nucleotidyltransferase
MRMTLHEVEIILKHAHTVFGSDVKVVLFGSRVDDSQKGGDIDLFIETEQNTELFEKKIAFIRLLEEALGEQKIDVSFKKTDKNILETEALSKGVVLDILTIKLDKYFNECEKHIQRINEAYSDMKTFVPLTVEKYTQLTKDEVQDIDQYLFRFAKLQDTMGDKIFKLILEKYEGSSVPSPFIDILNKLEKFGCISSAKEWLYLRKVRNEVAHQYDDEPEEMTQAINALLNQKEIIKNIFKKLKKCMNQVSVSKSK